MSNTTPNTVSHKCPHCRANIDPKAPALTESAPNEEDYREIELVLIGDTSLICDRWRPSKCCLT